MGNMNSFFGGLTDKKMKEVFEEYDKDTSGTVDTQELLCMMDDLKLGNKDPSKNVQFLAE